MKELKYPKDEQVWVQYFNQNRELLFILTNKAPRDFYFLYELSDGKFKRLGKSRSPKELEEKFNVQTRMGC